MFLAGFSVAVRNIETQKMKNRLAGRGLGNYLKNISSMFGASLTLSHTYDYIFHHP